MRSKRHRPLFVNGNTVRSGFGARQCVDITHMPQHRQTWVKVNAPVDEGIAQIVEALSAFEGLETIESCQGKPGEGRAFVTFRLGDWQACGRFVFEDLMPKIPSSLRSHVSLSIRAYDSDNAIAALEMHPAVIARVARLLRNGAGR